MAALVTMTFFCRFNEMASSATGETGKAAQTRALLFDMTFLMLIHIIQLYGLEVRSTVGVIYLLAISVRLWLTGDRFVGKLSAVS